MKIGRAFFSKMRDITCQGDLRNERKVNGQGEESPLTIDQSELQVGKDLILNTQDWATARHRSKPRYESIEDNTLVRSAKQPRKEPLVRHSAHSSEQGCKNTPMDPWEDSTYKNQEERRNLRRRPPQQAMEIRRRPMHANRPKCDRGPPGRKKDR